MFTGTYLFAATLLVTGPADPSGRAALPQPVGQSAWERLASEVVAANTANQNRGRAGRGGGNSQDGGGARRGNRGNPGPQGREPAQPGDRQRREEPPAGRVAPPPDTRQAPPPPVGTRRGENDRDRDGDRDRDRDRGRVRDGGRNVYVVPRTYAPRYYVYGYGTLAPRSYYYYYDRYPWYQLDYYGGAYSPGYFADYFDIGEIRLDVSPNFADVFVDGYYAGRVDDFDGVFQSMRLESGPHHIQVAAPGYVPLDFDVRIDPTRKITYRGDLIPGRP